MNHLKMKYLIYNSWLFLLLNTVACSNNTEFIIPKEDFTNLVTDMHIAEGMYKSLNLPHEFPNDTAFYGYIYERHGYSKVQFDSTLNYYINNKPRELIRIYSEVMTNISKMEVQAVANDNLPNTK